jgi:hypothetical protein
LTSCNRCDTLVTGQEKYTTKREEKAMMKKVYIDPVDNRKSFYGKCFVTEYPDGRKVLTSYETEVAEIVDGKFYRIWDKSSKTTIRHVDAFLAWAGLSGGGKKFWDAAPFRK